MFILRNNKDFDTLSFGSLSQHLVPCKLLLAVMFPCPGSALLEGPGFTLSHTVYDRGIFSEQDFDLGSKLPSLHPLRRNLAKGSFIHHLKEPLYKKTYYSCQISSDFLRGQGCLDWDSGCFMCGSCHFPSKCF